MIYHVQGENAQFAAVTASQPIEAHPLEFTGSGAAYFRVWLVNVVLTLLTLGFYTPLARRRSAQYFFGHTLVAGSPLEFSAPPGKMMFGFVLLVLLSLAYKIAAESGQTMAVALFFLGGAVLAPYLWASAMRFRMGATRWRGLRWQFTASWAEVYRASWPAFALALLWLVVVLGMQALLPQATQGQAAPTLGGGQWLALAAWLVLGLVGSVMCAIRLDFNFQRLRVARAQLGQAQGRWKPVYADFVRIWLATVGVFVASVLIAGLLFALLLGGSVALAFGTAQRNSPMMVVWLVLGAVAAVFVLFLASTPARAYREARLFRLQWGHTGLGQLARAKCHLVVRSYVLLRIKNVLLTLLTLGLYSPFARVQEYRMKLESVTLYIKGGVEQVAGSLAQAPKGAVADALADAAGLDLAL